MAAVAGVAGVAVTGAGNGLAWAVGAVTKLSVGVGNDEMPGLVVMVAIGSLAGGSVAAVVLLSLGLGASNTRASSSFFSDKRLYNCVVLGSGSR